MKNKKGFTLIEIIICVAILAVVGTTGIVVINNQKEKNNLIDYKDIILNAANVYVETNKETKEQLYNEKNAVYIPLRVLVNEGLLDFKSTKVTEKEINENYVMKAFTAASVTPNSSECLDITTITSFDDSINSPTYICTSKKVITTTDTEIKNSRIMDLHGFGIRYLLYWISGYGEDASNVLAYKHYNGMDMDPLYDIWLGENAKTNFNNIIKSGFISLNFLKGIPEDAPCPDTDTAWSSRAKQCIEISDKSSEYKIYFWYEEELKKTNNSTISLGYHLFIASDANIYIPTDYTNFFDGLGTIKTLKIDNLHMSKKTDGTWLWGDVNIENQEGEITYTD